MKKSGRGFSLVEIMVVISIIVILVALFAGRNLTRAKQRAQFTACAQNLKTVATGLMAYSNENDGRFPTTLATLTNKQLKAIPTCASALFNTYEGGYTKSSNPDNFTVFCAGSYHTGLGKSADYPQYTLAKGLDSQE